MSSKARVLGNTEQNWCRAVCSGTGVTVLALQLTKTPQQTSTLLHKIIQQLQKTHPLLRSKLHYNTTTKEFSFLTYSTITTPQFQIKIHDLDSTSNLLKNTKDNKMSPFHAIIEHEMNCNSWSDPNSFSCGGVDVLFTSVYSLSEGNKSVAAMRFHTAVCDRTTAITMLRELMEIADGGGVKNNNNINDGRIGEGEMGMESLVPSGMVKKTIWAHGRDMLGYSVNSLRLTNLRFENTKWTRSSEVVRLQMNAQQTARVLSECKSRGIKLCGALAAAGLIAAHSTKLNSDQIVHKKKYGVVTLTDCRSLLEPALSTHHYGSYHSAILNIHSIKGNETFWNLAERMYTDFARYKQCNRHLSDMADLNFLMRKAIENPSLTAQSSLRSSLLSVFEDPVFDNSDKIQQKIGVEDFMGCASVHGVGPSLALFDTIRDGALDCACVYPSPLHSRDQISELVDRMKMVLIDRVIKI